MECLFSRIIVTGKDRASFLHNFCTNNIRALEAGRAVEAFFTDARARVLGFGYVIALESRHEIWQPRASADRLLKHLSRYVIREDVSFSVPSDEIVTARKLTGDSKAMSATGAGDASAPETMLHFSWNGQPLFVVFGQQDGLQPEFAEAVALASEIAPEELEALRIAERLPAPGTDISDEQMAPEAGRNSTAISYTKGCYLGQEPIARLDAMGHVNRLLRCIRAAGPGVMSLTGAEVQAESGASLGVVTSSAEYAGALCGLAIVKLASAPAFVVLPDGQKLPVISAE